MILTKHKRTSSYLIAKLALLNLVIIIFITVIIFGPTKIRYFLNIPLVYTIIGGLTVGIILVYIEIMYLRQTERGKRYQLLGKKEKFGRNKGFLLKLFQSKKAKWNKPINESIENFKKGTTKYAWIDEDIWIINISRKKDYADFYILVKSNKYSPPLIIDKYYLRINIKGNIMEMHPISLV